MRLNGASRPTMSNNAHPRAVSTRPAGELAVHGSPRRVVWLAAAPLALGAGLLSSWATAPTLAQTPSGQPAPAIDFELQRQAVLAGVDAFLLRLKRDFSGALANYDEVLILYRRAGDREGEAKTFDDIAAVYEAMTEHQRAIAVREEGLAIARDGGHELPNPRSSRV